MAKAENFKALFKVYPIRVAAEALHDLVESVRKEGQRFYVDCVLDIKCKGYGESKDEALFDALAKLERSVNSEIRGTKKIRVIQESHENWSSMAVEESLES